MSGFKIAHVDCLIALQNDFVIFLNHLANKTYSNL